MTLFIAFKNLNDSNDAFHVQLVQGIVIMYPRKRRKDELASPDSLIFFAWAELVFLITRAVALNSVGSQGDMIEP